VFSGQMAFATGEKKTILVVIQAVFYKDLYKSIFKAISAKTKLLACNGICF
jgi:hypothetical protein